MQTGGHDLDLNWQANINRLEPVNEYEGGQIDRRCLSLETANNERVVVTAGPDQQAKRREA